MNREQLSQILTSSLASEQQLSELDEMIRKYPWFSLLRFHRLRIMETLRHVPDEKEVARAVLHSSDRKHLYLWIRGETGGLVETSLQKGTELEFMDDPGDLEFTDEVIPDFAANDDVEDLESDNEPAISDDQSSPFEFEPEEDHEEQKADDDASQENEPEQESKLTGDIEQEEDRSDLAEEEAPAEQEIDDADEAFIPPKQEKEMEDPELDEPLPVPVIDPIDEDDSEEETDQQEAAMDNGKSDNLIERFLNNDPGVIRADSETSLKGDMSTKSIEENDSFITDTLAKIYVKQGLHAKAIYAYERLSLKYPEKSAYFAAQIEKIKNITNA